MTDVASTFWSLATARYCFLLFTTIISHGRCSFPLDNSGHFLNVFLRRFCRREVTLKYNFCEQQYMNLSPFCRARAAFICGAEVRVLYAEQCSNGKRGGKRGRAFAFSAYRDPAAVRGTLLHR